MVKVAIPRLSVEQSISEFPKRRQRLLVKAAAQPLKSDKHGGVAIAQLMTGADRAAPNAALRQAANWFAQSHPTGNGVQGEVDFIALKLARAYYQFPGGGPQARLEESTCEAIRKYFLTQNFASKYNSENHHLLFRVSRLLMAHDLPDESFAAYKLTGQQAMHEDREWIRAFLEYRARRGWGEFDSPHYIETDLQCLLTLHDFAPDTEMQKMARMSLDVLLTDAVVDGRHGMLAGATGRIYERNALDHANDLCYTLSYLYFGDVDADAALPRIAVDPLLSGYRPDPLVVRIALERPGTYENRERKHLHNLADVRPVKPLSGSIRKLNRLTERYGLGTVVFQDPYPPGLPPPNYAGHEQHDWDLTLFSRTDARLFSHHPGKTKEHNYWTGDIGCRCGHFFQNRTTVLALYAIPADQPYQSIHAYVPRASFEEVVERSGVVFVRENNVYAALRLLGKPYTWAADGPWKDKEIISEGSPNGAICEVGAEGEYADFGAFQEAILAAKVEFDRSSAAPRLTYHSTRSGVLTLATDATRLIDGKSADLNYATYDCPYLHSDWDSGLVEMRHGNTRRVLNFLKITDSPG